MDGFWQAEGKQYTTFGEYDAATIPIYWDIAQEFGLGDNVFSSDPWSSLPNHWFIVSGQAPKQAQFYLETTSQEHAYLNQANKTLTIDDLRTQHHRCHGSTTIGHSRRTTAISGVQSNAYGAGSAYSYWNPLAAKAESYQNWYARTLREPGPEVIQRPRRSPRPWRRIAERFLGDPDQESRTTLPPT